MNGKKIAALILVMIIAGIAYGAQVMQKKASAMKAETASASDDRDNAQRALDTECIKQTRVDAECKEYRQFLKKWRPIIEHLQTGQEAEQVLMTIVRNSGIVILSQKFEVKENRNNPLMPKMLLGTLMAQDEYSKTLNWWGDLERRLPLIRVSACRIKQGENTRQINMEVHFEIPLVNLEAEIEQPKK
jgi:hypothetical protein